MPRFRIEDGSLSSTGQEWVDSKVENFPTQFIGALTTKNGLKLMCLVIVYKDDKASDLRIEIPVYDKWEPEDIRYHLANSNMKQLQDSDSAITLFEQMELPWK